MFLAEKANLLFGLTRTPTLSRPRPNHGFCTFKAKIISTLIATELHIASFHETEAMLASLLYEFQPRPDWVYLTTYGNSEMKTAAKAKCGRIVKHYLWRGRESQGVHQSCRVRELDFSKSEAA
jgi:hypothetical protein